MLIRTVTSGHDAFADNAVETQAEGDFTSVHISPHTHIWRAINTQVPKVREIKHVLRNQATLSDAQLYS